MPASQAGIAKNARTSTGARQATAVLRQRKANREFRFSAHVSAPFC